MTPKTPKMVVQRFVVAVLIPDGNKGYDETAVHVELITYNAGRSFITYAVDGIIGHMLIDSNGLTPKTYKEVKEHIAEQTVRAVFALSAQVRADIHNICTKNPK